MKREKDYFDTYSWIFQDDIDGDEWIEKDPKKERLVILREMTERDGMDLYGHGRYFNIGPKIWKGITREEMTTKQYNDDDFGYTNLQFWTPTIYRHIDEIGYEETWDLFIDTYDKFVMKIKKLDPELWRQERDKRIGDILK